jgi:hypothetical protein
MAFCVFGQAVVNAINFWVFKLLFSCKDATCHKLRGSTNFVFFGPIDQKLWVFEVFRPSLGSQKTFYFLTFLGWISFYRFSTKFLIIPST